MLKNLTYLKTCNQHTAKTNSHRNKYNEQIPFSNATCPCELVVQLPIFEKHGLASVLQSPFRTGSKHLKKWVAPHAGVGTKDGSNTKKHNL